MGGRSRQGGGGMNVCVCEGVRERGRKRLCVCVHVFACMRTSVCVCVSMPGWGVSQCVHCQRSVVCCQPHAVPYQRPPHPFHTSVRVSANHTHCKHLTIYPHPPTPSPPPHTWLGGTPVCAVSMISPCLLSATRCSLSKTTPSIPHLWQGQCKPHSCSTT